MLAVDSPLDTRTSQRLTWELCGRGRKSVQSIIKTMRTAHPNPTHPRYIVFNVKEPGKYRPTVLIPGPEGTLQDLVFRATARTTAGKTLFIDGTVTLDHNGVTIVDAPAHMIIAEAVGAQTPRGELAVTIQP